jgi:hypothetical protein
MLFASVSFEILASPLNKNICVQEILLQLYQKYEKKKACSLG